MKSVIFWVPCDMVLQQFGPWTQTFSGNHTPSLPWISLQQFTSSPSSVFCTACCSSLDIHIFIWHATSPSPGFLCFHQLSHSSFQPWAGLYQAGFSTCASLSLLFPSASFLLGLLFNPEDGGTMFLQNVSMITQKTYSSKLSLFILRTKWTTYICALTLGLVTDIYLYI
jgi:hypothetical protein